MLVFGQGDETVLRFGGHGVCFLFSRRSGYLVGSIPVIARHVTVFTNEQGGCFRRGTVGALSAGRRPRGAGAFVRSLPGIDVRTLFAIFENPYPRRGCNAGNVRRVGA